MTDHVRERLRKFPLTVSAIKQPLVSLHLRIFIGLGLSLLAWWELQHGEMARSVTDIMTKR